jgi:hypothetical protein
MVESLRWRVAEARRRRIGEGVQVRPLEPLPDFSTWRRMAVSLHEFDYRDETWSQVRQLERIRRLRRLGVRWAPKDNRCPNSKAAVSEDGTGLVVASSHRADDWTYFISRDEFPGSFAVTFDVTVDSVFTEVQIEFRRHSIVERCRFIIKDNQRLVFSIVRHGHFYFGLGDTPPHATEVQYRSDKHGVPCSLGLGRTYGVAVIVRERAYSFYLDGVPLLAVDDYTDTRGRGKVALLLWHDTGDSDVRARVENFACYALAE